MRLPDRKRLISRRSPRTLPHETFRRQAHLRHPPIPEKSVPLAANARIFVRSQGAQRNLLCLGEPLDAGDSEALIGSIPPQCLQRLATLEVPEPDGSVIAANGQPGASGTHLERMHRSLMGFLHPHAIPALQIPPAQRTVLACVRPMRVRSLSIACPKG